MPKKPNSRNLTVVLRNLDKHGFASVYVQYTYQRQPKRFPTGVKVLPDGFEDGKVVPCQKVAKWAEHNATVAARNSDIDKVRTELDGLIQLHQLQFKALPPLDWVAERFEAPRNVEKGERRDFWQCFDALQIESEASVKQKTAKNNTVRTLKPLRTLLREFETARGIRLTFDSFDYKLFGELNSFMLADGMLNGSIRTRLAKLKAVLNHFVREGACKNVAFREYRFDRTKQKDAPNNQRIFALSEQEFDEWRAVNLSDNPRLEYARDLFVLCASTGLRYSDAIRVKPTNVSGGVLRITTQKTGDNLAIPLNEKSAAVLAKYPKGMKAVDLALYNARLLEIAQRCPSLHVPFETMAYSGGREVRRTKGGEVKEMRWQHVTSHAGRRTFVCLCLAKGFPEFKIRSWTGHKDLSSFVRYVDTETGGNAIMAGF